MKTHERTFQTMKFAGIAILGVTMGFCVFGCTNTLTNPSPAYNEQHPNALLLNAYTQCYAKFHGVEVRVMFTEEEYLVPYDYTKPGENIVPAAGWIGWGSDPAQIHYYGPWYRGEMEYEVIPWTLAAVASHEVCHATGIYDESFADLCGQKALGECYE